MPQWRSPESSAACLNRDRTGSPVFSERSGGKTGKAPGSLTWGRLWRGQFVRPAESTTEERLGVELVTICPRRAVRSTGRCGVSPLEGVGPHEVGPRRRPSPTNPPALSTVSVVGHDLLQPRVFLLKLLEPLRLADIHHAELLLPSVIGLLADA